MATIFDVAREAGVGIGTVSRVLNGSPLVSEATRQRVEDAITRLRYRPSSVARAFGRRRTERLEVLVPHFVEPFFFELLMGIEDALADADSEYSLHIRAMTDAADRDRVLGECCRKNNVDGVLVLWTPPTEGFVKRLERDRVPAVLVNASHPSLPSVAVDHDRSAAQAVEYCARIGHRRIALVDRFIDPFGQSGAGACQAGYRAAMSVAGAPVVAGYERVVPLTAESAAEAVTHLLEMPEPPTAILVGSDVQAIGALQAARARGRQVPRDLSLVAYNENSVSRYLGLTTIRVPLRVLARQGLQLLLQRVQEPNLAASVTYLDTELVVRGTCAPPRA
jgi:DNA-binding LacI/PurR family transcriptional regulator